MSTRREIADGVTRSFGFDKDGFITCDPAALIDAINKALLDRDDRAAIKAHLYISRAGFNKLANDVAAAIRKDD